MRYRESLKAAVCAVMLLVSAVSASLGEQAAVVRQGGLVVITAAQIELQFDGPNQPTDNCFQVYKVLKVEGERLLVSTEMGYPTGWVKRSSIVPLAQAVAYFGDRIQSAPRSAEFRFLRGSVRLRRGETQAGLDDLAHAIRIDPRFAPAYIGLGLGKISMRDLPGAERAFDEGIRLNSTSALAYLCRGQLYWETDRLDQAAADFTKAISLQQSNGFLYSKRASFSCSISKKDMALGDYNIGIRLAPEIAWPRLGRANIFLERDEFRLALADLDEAVRIDPYSDEALAARANARKELGDITGAIGDCNAALRISPHNPVAHAVRGSIWLNKGDLVNAYRDLNAAVFADPKRRDFYFLRGVSELRLGEPELAIVDFDEVLRSDPGYLSAYCLRARAWRQKGEYGKAKSDLDKAMCLSPRFGLGCMERAELCIATGDFDQALTRLDDAVEYDPSLAESAAAQRSWIYATCPEPAHRNGQRAIENAERVLMSSRAQGQPPDRKTELAGSILMATGHAEAGDFASAVKWQRRAIEIYKAKDDATTPGSAPGADEWLEKVLRSLENRQAHRAEHADTQPSVAELRQPRLLGSVRSPGRQSGLHAHGRDETDRVKKK